MNNIRLHLVDGTYELFRMHFGAPSRTAPDGREVGATVALLRTLVKLLQSPGVSHVGVAFDHVIESFRNELFAGYKTGEGISPALLAQFPLAEQAADALGLVVWPMERFEADDALASAAARFANDPQVEQILLCTPDKDLAQCVLGQRVVCLDRRKDLVLDEAAVIEKFGVLPNSIPDYLALVGDAADGIPGIPRWGARSSAAVLSQYGNLEAIPDSADDWALKVRGAAALARNLSAARSDALLYKRLATLRLDVNLSLPNVDALRWSGPRKEKLRRFSERLGISDLNQRF